MMKPQGGRGAQRSRLQMQANLLLAASSFALLFMYSMTPIDRGDDMVLPGVTDPNDILESLQDSAEPTTLSFCSDADTTGRCRDWAAREECDRNPAAMYRNCLSSCGGCEQVYRPSVARKVQLWPGVEMPLIGFGTAGLGDETSQAVTSALDAGYRKIDTAQAREWYREDLVGDALTSSSIPREKIFLTTKVHPRDFGTASTMAAMQRSLENLRTRYIDLVLLHYPNCWGDLCGDVEPKGTWKESWAALETLVDEGVVRCLGVSNFNIGELAQLLKVARIRPCLVQLNSEPLKPAFAEQAFCRRHAIQFEGYSTLGGQYGTSDINPVMDHETVIEIAATRERTHAQVLLRWALQQGQSVIPRTSKAWRMESNLEVYDFTLTDDDMDRLMELAGKTSVESVEGGSAEQRL